MSQLNFNISQSRISSMQILLGLAPIPERIAKQVNIKKDERDPKVKSKKDTVANKGGAFQETRVILTNNIYDAIKAGLIHSDAIWSHIQALEEKTGNKIFMRTRLGNLMSRHTFDYYVLYCKRAGKPVPPSKGHQIIKLFKSGKTEHEIRELTDFRHAHIHRCLVDAGLKMKRFTPARNYNHNKRK